MKRLSLSPSRSFLLVSLLIMIVLAACQSNGDQADSTVNTNTEMASQDTVETSSNPNDNQPTSADDTNETNSDLRTFQIVSEQSEARFYIDEVLRGEPVTVIGVTSQVTGEIHLNPDQAAQTEVGPIQINARDLTTDSSRRNGAIQRFVLQSNKDEFQFITFTPRALEGLPEAVAVGDTFDFQIVGDLTIRDTTQSETFAVSVTAISADEIGGLGSATIRYADYGLFIPDVPFVASVADEVILEIEFMATAQ